MSFTNRDVVAQAINWSNQGQRVVLGTVLETWGSAPRPAGSLMAICPPHAITGSVSGGCVENDLAMKAVQLEEQGFSLVEYGVADEDAFAVGLACGGHIKVALQEFNAKVFPNGYDGRNHPGYLIQDLDGGPMFFVSQDNAKDASWYDGNKSGPYQHPATNPNIFVNPLLADLRIICVGAVHIAQHLEELARILGHDMVVVDPREAFLTKQRFPNSQHVVGWPDEVMKDGFIDRHSAVVSLTHDEKIDDPGLMAALKSDAFYVGALGSTRTHAKRLARLASMGFDDKELQRIHGPVGLPIGAKGPGEIALSIMAQIIECWRKR